jgi:hypothetical protein
MGLKQPPLLIADKLKGVVRLRKRSPKASAIDECEWRKEALAKSSNQ